MRTPTARHRAALEITGERLVLRGCAERVVAVVVDGQVRATLATEAGAAEWAMPHDLFGRLLDVVATASGASVLAAPVALDAYRSVHWIGWAREGRMVEARFNVSALGARALPIAVGLMADGVRYGFGFAALTDGEYVARITLDRLPPDDHGLLLSPAIGGFLVPVTLRVPPDAFDHVGYVDRVAPWGARGWVVNRQRPEERVVVALSLDGRQVATARAETMRDDVAAAGIGDGRSGFQIPFPAGVPLDRPLLVDVRVAPDGPSLVHSPYLQQAAPEFVGHFDGMDGFYAGGWVIAAASVGRAVRVEAVCDGVVVGSALADLHRGDVASAGLPVARCGFHFALTGKTARLLDREVSIRVEGTDHVLPGSPRLVTASPLVAAFLGRSQSIRPAVLTRLRRALTHRTRGLLVSLIMPVHETRRDWLVEAIQSVRAQWSENWELVCVDDGSRAPHVAEVLAGFARADKRIRVLRSAENVGIARAVNFGLRAARGEYVAFLDHDDALEPDAVYHLARAARETGADLLYSDEALTGAGLDQLLELRARPAFSHDYYLSHPYFVHLVGVRTSLAQALGGYDESLSISADVDFVLRAIERAGAVTHIARVLYRWRTHPGSAGHRRRGEVMAATQASIERHLRRLGQDAAVRPGLGFNQFRVDWPDDGSEVLIVIPTRDRVDLLRQCISSVERTTRGERCRIVVIDHESTDAETLRYLRRIAAKHAVMPFRGRFNYAKMNNRAVRQHAKGAPYVLFLNNDVEALERGWLARLRSLARRPDVGAVGPMLLYGNGRVQHAGVLVGFGAGADHAMRFADPAREAGGRNPGYNNNLTSLRDYSAVTAACMMVRRDAFEQVGGFDEQFPVGYNDTDLCLRLRRAGYAVLYDGHTVLTHHESATRASNPALAEPAGDDARLRARWPQYFEAGDPYYSPLLTQTGRDHHVRDEMASDRARPYRVVVPRDWQGGKPR